MEIQLQELIDQIKNDGVKAAEEKAATILESARAEAEKIVSDAKAEAQKIMLEAKEQNERFVRAGEDSIRRAGRNLLISFRESVVKELDAVIGDQVKEALSSESLAQLILTAVENWTKNTEAEDISVLIGSKELASIFGFKNRQLTDSRLLTLPPQEFTVLKLSRSGCDDEEIRREMHFNAAALKEIRSKLEWKLSRPT